MIAASYGNSMFSFVETATVFSKVAVPSYIPTNSEWESLFSTILLALATVSVLDFSRSNRYLVVSHCLNC